MEGKEPDTDDEFNVPSYDPPSYGSLTAPSPAPIPTNVLLAETTPDIDMKIRESEFKMKGETIKLQNRIEKLEMDMKLCCPNYDKLATNIQSRFRGNKDRTETARKYPPKVTNVTKGWIVVIGGSAFSGDVGTHGIAHNSEPKRVIDRRKFVLDMGLVAFSMRNTSASLRGRQDWWPRDQTKDPNIMLKESIREGHTDTHISPGVSFQAIKDKMSEGFKIVFDDKNDERSCKLRAGYKKKKRKSKKKKYKRSSKKKKSKRSSKKKRRR
jgi:hypothetical protein